MDGKLHLTVYKLIKADHWRYRFLRKVNKKPKAWSPENRSPKTGARKGGLKRGIKKGVLVLLNEPDHSFNSQSETYFNQFHYSFKNLKIVLVLSGTAYFFKTIHSSVISSAAFNTIPEPRIIEIVIKY